MDNNVSGGPITSAAFIDGSYPCACWSATTSASVDAAAVRAALVAVCGGSLEVAYYFDARYADGSGREALRCAMARQDFRVKANYRIVWEWVRDELGNVVRDRSGRIVTRACQKGVDVGLALTLDRSQRAVGWTRLALVAGDGDFAEIVQELVEGRGVELILIGCGRSTSLDLLPYAVKFVEVSTLMTYATPARVPSAALIAGPRNSLTGVAS